MYSQQDVYKRQLYDTIIAQALSYGIAFATVEEIEEHNILGATFLAMNRAIAQLSPQPEMCIRDRCSMDQRLERILPRVQKPARYTGGEYRQIIKDKAEVDLLSLIHIYRGRTGGCAGDAAGHGYAHGASPALRCA